MHKITDDNFEAEVLKSDVPVLLDFWADWCYPCRLIAPVIEELSKEYEGKLKVGKLDTDVNQNTAFKYDVSGIPTLILFRNGEVLERIVGLAPKQTIKEKLDYYLSAQK